MTRGEIYIGLGDRDFGKPRPFVIVQNDRLNAAEHPASYLACPISSDIEGHPFRMTLPADNATGLRRPSEIMVDKLAALRPEKVRSRIGRCSDEQMGRLEVLLAFVLGLRAS